MIQDPLSPRRETDDDGFLRAIYLFVFFLVCVGASAYLYWRGTGKLPWA